VRVLQDSFKQTTKCINKTYCHPKYSFGNKLW